MSGAPNAAMPAIKRDLQWYVVDATAQRTAPKNAKSKIGRRGIKKSVKTFSAMQILMDQ